MINQELLEQSHKTRDMQQPLGNKTQLQTSGEHTNIKLVIAQL